MIFISQMIGLIFIVFLNNFLFFIFNRDKKSKDFSID